MRDSSGTIVATARTFSVSDCRPTVSSRMSSDRAAEASIGTRLCVASAPLVTCIPAIPSTLGVDGVALKGHPPRACCIQSAPLNTSAVAAADMSGAPIRRRVLKGVIGRSPHTIRWRGQVAPTQDQVGYLRQ